MADWRDVMEARHDADDRRRSLDTLAGQIEDGGKTPAPELVLALGAALVASELRALGTLLDYARGDAL